MNRETSKRLRDYYKQPSWKQFTKHLTDDPNCVCELCGTRRWKILKNGDKKLLKRFEVHHKHYNSLYKEKRSDVMILCSSCHNICHSILRRSSESNFFISLKTLIKEYFPFEKE